MPVRYLLDANCFTEPFHHNYCFDICPGFWEWLLQQNRLGVVYSIDRILGEITKSDNDLKTWAKSKDDGNLFLSTKEDLAVANVYGEIAKWVEASHFKRKGKDEFMGGEDAWLIAYAVAHDFTVVTYERYNKDVVRYIKIPALCQPFGFRAIMLHQALRETHVRFALRYEKGWDSESEEAE